jgi:hypothetical protein
MARRARRDAESASPCPQRLTNVSKAIRGKTDLGDGYTRWDWQVQYPINNYSVSLNIGNYVHFADRSATCRSTSTCCPAASTGRSAVRPGEGDDRGLQHYFGEYPVQQGRLQADRGAVLGMEHQSAVTYGNRFANGYLERDWTGVGISPKFDFIIIHESGHEWFGNAVSAADVSDMWIHEGWTTYLENLYVEHRFGYDDALKYVNGYKSKVATASRSSRSAASTARRRRTQYFKGALFLNTAPQASWNDDDAVGDAACADFYQAL